MVQYCMGSQAYVTVLNDTYMGVVCSVHSREEEMQFAAVVLGLNMNVVWSVFLCRMEVTLYVC